MTSIEDLQRVLDIAEAVMMKVTADDLNKATPCSEWNVQALANHMTGGCLLFSRAAGGEAITERPAPSDLIGSDPGHAYARAAEAAGEAWSRPGALDGTITIPAGQLPGNVAMSINAVDQLLHACDLARALGHDVVVPDDLAESILGFMNVFLTPERRGPGKPFGQAVEISEDAPVVHRMLAFAGRQP